MQNLEALAARIQALEDVEAIKKTMYRYWRYLDHKHSDQELGELFTEDVVADYGMPGWQATGREALLKFLTPERRPEQKLSHGGHNPEVELLDAVTAQAFFTLHDWVTLEGRTVMRGFGQYAMRFTKTGGSWRIQRLNLHYLYREEQHLYVDNENVGFGPGVPQS